jgi:SAM-dependent methyltransferase
VAFDALKGRAIATPLIGPLLTKIRDNSFRHSAQYWERRYQRGGNSGPGSYNRLAVFKADFLNEFVEREQIESVMELGCGDGAQLKLARYPRYLGVDVSPSAVARCRSVFGSDPNKSFVVSSELADDAQADLALSLDVIFHLVEDDTFEAYMRNLFRRSRRFVVVYSSNREDSSGQRHVRHREFTKWIEKNEANWRLVSKTLNRYPFDPQDPEHTSFANFFVFEPRHRN